MIGAVITLTIIHFGASIYSYWRNPTKIDKELVVQHHERCTMYGLIALAILMR